MDAEGRHLASHVHKVFGHKPHMRARSFMTKRIFADARHELMEHANVSLGAAEAILDHALEAHLGGGGLGVGGLGVGGLGVGGLGVGGFSWDQLKNVARSIFGAAVTYGPKLYRLTRAVTGAIGAGGAAGGFSFGSLLKGFSNAVSGARSAYAKGKAIAQKAHGFANQYLPAASALARGVGFNRVANFTDNVGRTNASLGDLLARAPNFGAGEGGYLIGGAARARSHSRGREMMHKRARSLSRGRAMAMGRARSRSRSRSRGGYMIEDGPGDYGMGGLLIGGSDEGGCEECDGACGGCILCKSSGPFA